MKTCVEVSEWCAGALESFGDPSLPICQLFIRWQDGVITAPGENLACAWLDDELVLFLGPEFRPLPMTVEAGNYKVSEDGQLSVYGAELVTAGVWAITPSLNVEGAIHAFLVLYGVPDPAPWERRIVLP